jgi:hypothetical protein
VGLSLRVSLLVGVVHCGCWGGCKRIVHSAFLSVTPLVVVSPSHVSACLLPLLLLLLQFDAHQKTALVVYPETHEEEWINLTELVRDKCIAVGEWCGVWSWGVLGSGCACCHGPWVTQPLLCVDVRQRWG